MLRTSLTNPIRVEALPVRNGHLGLTFCPGKHGDSLNGAPCARDLDTDLRTLRDWGAGLVVTLIESHEFDLLRVPDLGEGVVAQGMKWVHLPIRDRDVPAAPFLSGWPAVRADVISQLDAGGGACDPPLPGRPRQGWPRGGAPSDRDRRQTRGGNPGGSRGPTRRDRDGGTGTVCEGLRPVRERGAANSPWTTGNP